jgi:mevalonate kinase
MAATRKFDSYSSKVLLFGEHIINKGARGLAMPTEQFSGCFSFEKTDDDSAKKSNESLLKLAHYITRDSELENIININQFLTDIENGLTFDSNIPQGFGLGSSGALVAAIVGEYGHETLKKSSDVALRDIMAKLESCFHGKSSGLDPIVSYLNTPLIVAADDIKRVKFKKNKETYFDVSLVDTGIARQTSTWVNTFMKMTKDEEFARLLDLSYLPANEICIDAFLANKYAHFWKSLKIISQLQYTYLREFIPRSLWKSWEQGLRYNEFYLKLCGAGGGGFMLCFAKKESENSDLIAQKKRTILSF